MRDRLIGSLAFLVVSVASASAAWLLPEESMLEGLARLVCWAASVFLALLLFLTLTELIAPARAHETDESVESAQAEGSGGRPPATHRPRRAA